MWVIKDIKKTAPLLRSPMNKKLDIILPTNSTTTTIERNRYKLNIKVINTTSKTITYLANTKQNNQLKPEGGVYAIVCNICHKNP